MNTSNTLNTFWILNTQELHHWKINDTKTDDPHSLFVYSTSRGHFSDGRSDREMGLERWQLETARNTSLEGG
jgi:hypothetical protein